MSSGYTIFNIKMVDIVLINQDGLFARVIDVAIKNFTHFQRLNDFFAAFLLMLLYLDGYRLIRNSVLEDVNVDGAFELNQKLLNCTSWLEIAN